MRGTLLTGLLLLGLIGLPGCSLEWASDIEEECAKLEGDCKILQSKLVQIGSLRREVEEMKMACDAAEAKKASLLEAHPEILKQFPALKER